MPRTKSDKPKRNVWRDPSPYGTYEGEPGSPEQWASTFKGECAARWDAAYAKTIFKDESPYDILGVKPGALWDEIKKAFRLLALRSHPDKGGNPETFRKILAAYVFLEEQLSGKKTPKSNSGDQDHGGDHSLAQSAT